MKRRFSTGISALWGAGFGFVFTIGRMLLAGNISSNGPYVFGAVVGGVIAGAVLFMVGASICNLFVRK